MRGGRMGGGREDYGREGWRIRERGRMRGRERIYYMEYGGNT